MNKIELLAPAGDLEKLIIAVVYGADAVYFGGEDFSLRAGAGGFSFEEMEEGIAFVHKHNKKCYLTLNIYAHNEDIEPLTDYLTKLQSLSEMPDGILISDPGIMMMVKEHLPEVDIHLSTQANMTNYQTAKFWRKMGMKRLVLARELSLGEIKRIHEELVSIEEGDDEPVEIEAFVHGAMCISYSGRCLLSNVMTGRDSNRGMCAHPCRYKYTLMEEKRPGEYYPIEEDSRGTYIMNSKDLCMIEHIPDLINAGISSLKIEGRMKTIYYIACIIGAYRKAIDSYYNHIGSNPSEEWKLPRSIFDELIKASHREFTTGFYYGKPDENSQNYETSAYVKDYSFVGLIKEYDEDSATAVVEQRNKFSIGDEIEFFGPDGLSFIQEIKEMWDERTGEPIETAPHAQQIVKVKVENTVKPFYMMRRKEK